MKSTRRTRKAPHPSHATGHQPAGRRRPRRAEGATSGELIVVGEPVGPDKDTAVIPVFQTSLSRRARLRITNCTFQRCEAVIFDGADHVLDGAERLVNRMVAIVLMGIAMFAVVASVVTLATTSAPPAAAMTSTLDSMLFAVILVEITATMRREERHSKLKWYLVIGIVSAIREILLVGARISLHSIPAHEVSSAVLEMGVTIMAVIGLSVALRLAGRDKDSMPDPPQASHEASQHALSDRADLVASSADHDGTASSSASSAPVPCAPYPRTA